MRLTFDAHQRGGLAVHAHRDDGAADARARSMQIEQTGQRQRERHADEPVDRHDDTGPRSTRAEGSSVSFAESAVKPTIMTL